MCLQWSTTWADGPAASRRVRILGPGLLAGGLAVYGILQISSSPIAVAGWFVALFVAGTGIGMAFPHIATAAMTITTDDAEAARASAGVNTVQMVANTFGCGGMWPWRTASRLFSVFICIEHLI